MTDLTKRLKEIHERVEQANCMEFQYNPEATVIHDDAPAMLAALEAVAHEADKGRGPHAPYLTDYELGQVEALVSIWTTLEDRLGGDDD